MSSIALPAFPMTYDDVLDIPDLERRELIEGELFVSPAPHWQHQDVLIHLIYHFGPRVLVTKGKLLSAPIDFKISETTVLQPDLLYLSPAKSPYLSKSGQITGPPDLVLEIVSPLSRGTDSFRKPNLYAKAGVPEYWLVDPGKQQMAVHSLHVGRYIINTSNADGSVSSRVLPDLSIDPAAFFRELLG